MPSLPIVHRGTVMLEQVWAFKLQWREIVKLQNTLWSGAQKRLPLYCTSEYLSALRCRRAAWRVSMVLQTHTISFLLLFRKPSMHCEHLYLTQDISKAQSSFFFNKQHRGDKSTMLWTQNDEQLHRCSELSTWPHSDHTVSSHSVPVNYFTGVIFWRFSVISVMSNWTTVESVHSGYQLAMVISNGTINFWLTEKKCKKKEKRLSRSTNKVSNLIRIITI